MVRIRHPNLFVDKCDGNVKILLVHSEKKRSACRNLFFYFFVHLRKKSPNVLRKSVLNFWKFLEISGNFRNLGKITPIFRQQREFFAFERQIRSFRHHIFGIWGEKSPKFRPKVHREPLQKLPRSSM